MGVQRKVIRRLWVAIRIRPRDRQARPLADQSTDSSDNSTVPNNEPDKDRR